MKRPAGERNCADLTSDLLAEAVLDPGCAAAPEVRAHAAACPACRGRLEAIAVVAARLGGDGLPVPDPDSDFAVLDMVARAQEAGEFLPRSRLPWAVAWGLAAACIAYGLILLARPDPASAPGQAPPTIAQIPGGSADVRSGFAPGPPAETAEAGPPSDPRAWGTPELQKLVQDVPPGGGTAPADADAGAAPAFPVAESASPPAGESPGSAAESASPEAVVPAVPPAPPAAIPGIAAGGGGGDAGAEPPAGAGPAADGAPRAETDAPSPAAGTEGDAGAPAPEAPPAGPAFARGDANGDGRVDAADCMLITRYVTGAAGAVLPSADFNGDGKVDIVDALLISREVMGKR